MSLKSFSYRLLGVLILSCLMMGKVIASPADSVTVECPFIKMTPQRLPDLNVPRFAHRVCYLNGELTVFGGHTSGFVLEQSAEYFKDGQWHMMQMVYNHDDGICVPLRNGKVLLAGGYDKNLGIDQTFEAELYDPATHTFEGFGTLYHKRAHGVGIEANNGKVYISGNWYNVDGIEVYEGEMQFAHVKETSEQRSLPYLFRTSDGDVMVVNGCVDYRDKPIYSSVVDRAKGSSFNVPLLETWRPYLIHNCFLSETCFIGNEKKGEYAYLLPLQNEEGQVAIAEVRDTVFTLLPTNVSVPMKGPYGKIHYHNPVVVDREIQRGYIMAYDTVECHRYILAIDYAKRPAELTMYYTDPMRGSEHCCPVLSPDGDLVITGGVGVGFTNFSPISEVWLFPFGKDRPHISVAQNRWWWLGALVLVALLVGLLLIRYYRRKHSSVVPEVVTSEIDSAKNEELLARLQTLMQNDKPYLESELNMSDIADRLGVHRNDVSACVNSCLGISFSQFVNEYRVEYAKRLLTYKPDMKMIQIAMESGFSSDTSFFRTFKALVGMTPKEWQITK